MIIKMKLVNINKKARRNAGLNGNLIPSEKSIPQIRVAVLLIAWSQYQNLLKLVSYNNKTNKNNEYIINKK